MMMNAKRNNVPSSVAFRLSRNNGQALHTTRSMSM